MANVERLMALAAHLENGILGHDQFYFGHFNAGDPTTKKQRFVDPSLDRCGISGCAIGECPFIFPEWVFNNEWLPVLIGQPHPQPSAMIWFDLSHAIEYEHLFVHDRQKPLRFGGCMLSKNASRGQLAANIIEFCRSLELN